jgi:general L-amino acid transport system substrate-binding protein
MTTIIKSLVALLIVTCFALSASAQATLEAVKKRDRLLCGVNGGLPGFSLQNAQQQWEGIDVDMCRGVAAAVLGDAKKVTFIPTTAQNRFDRLVAGEFDMLSRNSTITLQRATGNRARFAVVNYYDGQAFVVPKKAGIARVSGLSDRIVCVTKGTTHQFNLMAWLKLRGTSALVLTLDTDAEMYKAFFDGRCVAVTADATALAATLITSGKATDYMMLPDFISKEPLGPFVRNGDSPWLDIVRWTHYAMVEAEEREITKNNVDGRRQDATDPNVRMLLGADPGNGKALGLDEKWAYNVIKQVGNYSEIFERNVGQRSALGFARGTNALWNKGGLMFALPLR